MKVRKIVCITGEAEDSEVPGMVPSQFVAKVRKAYPWAKVTVRRDGKVTCANVGGLVEFLFPVP